MNTDLRGFLVQDGLEYIGEFLCGKSLVVGDPARIGTASFRTDIDPGTWWLFLRMDERDQPQELVACRSNLGSEFYEQYDSASVQSEFLVDSGRLAILDAALSTDVGLLREMFEPDDLPWVLDRAAVCEGRSPARVYVGDERPIRLLSVAFGPAPVIAQSAPISE